MGDKLKILEFRRGQSTDIVKCENGDLYDSEAVLYSADGAQLYISEHWNTDATKGYNGGRLAKGTYFAKKDKRTVTWSTEPQDCLRIFRTDGIVIDQIKTMDDIPEENFRLPSEIPNPNHVTAEHPEGEMWMDSVLVHPGSITWDWSHGCLTGLNFNGYTTFDSLNALLADGEIVILRLV